jgi:hypothetical protein
LADVRNAQVAVGAADSQSAWVDTDDLALVDPEHFGTANQQILGRRYAGAIAAMP